METTPMRRVLVIGSGGAGKSTLAARLGERLGLPVVHLDAHYWRPGWVEPSKAAWVEQVRQLVAEEAWVMDGNYSGTLAVRVAAADTVVFLDFPRMLCLWRVVRRRVRYHASTRPDMAPGCVEHLDATFLWWIWSYPWRRRPRVLAMIAAAEGDRRLVVLRSPREVHRFLDGMGPEGTR